MKKRKQIPVLINEGRAPSASRRLSATPPRLQPSHAPGHGDFMYLMYEEFRWQRKLNTLLVLGLLILLPFLLWWMQSSSLNNALTNKTTPNTAAQTNSTDTPSSVTTLPASTKTGSAGIPGTNGAAGPRGGTGAPGSQGKFGQTLLLSGGACPQNSCVTLLSDPNTSPQAGNINISGTITAAQLVGDGSQITDVDAATFDSQPASFYTDASNLNSGTLADSRLSSNVAQLDGSPVFTSDITAPHINLTNPLAVASGGTGRTSLPAGGLLVGNGTNPVQSVAGNNGECLVMNGGSPTFTSCPQTDLQTGFNMAGTGPAEVVTSLNNNKFSLRAGSGLDNSSTFQVQNSLGESAFEVGTDDSSVSVGGSNVSGGGQLNVRVTSMLKVGQVIQGAANQAGDLLQFKDAGGSPLARVDALGNAFFRSVTQSTGSASFNVIQAGGNVTSNGNVGIGVTTPLARLQIAASPAQVAQLIKAAPLQVADLFQIQDENGVSLLRVDAGGKLYAKNISISNSLAVNGHVSSGGGIPVITSAVTGLVPVLVGNDTAGTVVLTAALGANAGIVAHVDFAANYTTPPKVLLTANTAAGASIGAYVTVTANGFNIVSTSAAAVASVCSFSYIIIE